MFVAITLLSAAAQLAIETESASSGSLSPRTGRKHGYGGGSGYSVSARFSSSWIVANTNSWITITSPTNGTGNGTNTVTYTVARNPDLQPRIGSITIGGHSFLVTQLANDPVFAMQPTNQSVVVGGAATFTASVRGTPPFTYQWFFNDSPLTDGDGVSGTTTSNLVLTGIQETQAGKYRVWVTSGVGTNDSTGAKLFVSSGNAGSGYGSAVDPTPSVPTPKIPTRLRFMARTATNATLSVQGEAGKRYVVEGSWELIHWVPISTNSAVSTVNDAVGNAPRRFYRAVEVP